MRSLSIQKSLELTKLAETRWGPKRRWHCVYCGRGVGMVVDHFVPAAQGGTDEVWNLVPACDRCNGSKRDHAPRDWMKAVGVTFNRYAWLVNVTQPGRTAPFPRELHIPRLELNYSAMRANKAPKQPIQGVKGA